MCSTSTYAQDLLSDVLNHLPGSRIHSLILEASVDELNYVLLDELLNDPSFDAKSLRDSLHDVVLPWYHGVMAKLHVRS
jgi:hypothetical protein